MCGRDAQTSRAPAARVAPRPRGRVRKPGGPRTYPASPGPVPHGRRQVPARLRRSGHSPRRIPPRRASLRPGFRPACLQPRPASCAGRLAAGLIHGEHVPSPPRHDHRRQPGAQPKQARGSNTALLPGGGLLRTHRLLRATCAPGQPVVSRPGRRGTFGCPGGTRSGRQPNARWLRATTVEVRVL